LDVKTTRLKHVMPKVTSDPALGQALSLMKKRSLASVEKAVSLLRGAHLRDPDNLEVKLELADALNTVMRIKTNANALVIEGTLDTPGNKRVWKTLGEEALPLARAAYKGKPGDVRALAVYADAFMFSCSAKGIVKQAGPIY
jgi:predicted Zn-dependent protease